jgi:hypothetical protein
MTPKKIIYIAGPYRGKTGWEIEENIRRAERIALEVWQKGYAAICPHANSRFFFGELDEDHVLEGCLEILRRSDGMLLIPGWEASEGARVEWSEALGRRIPIYFSLAELPPAD